MYPHSSTLALKIPWTEEPGRLQSMGSLRVGHDRELHFHFSLLCIGEGNGNPLQCSCLENPRNGEPGGLRSMGSHRVGHDWRNLAAAAASIISLGMKLLVGYLWFPAEYTLFTSLTWIRRKPTIVKASFHPRLLILFIYFL